MICVLDTEHPHSETLNKKGHAASAITDGVGAITDSVSKVGSRLFLSKKKDKDEHKKSVEEKIAEKVIPDKSNDNEFVPKKSKETKPINDKQEEGKEEPIPPNQQEKPSANHVEMNQKEKQKLEKTNGIKPYNVDKPKQEEENNESATRHIEFKEEPKLERKPDEGSRSSEENGNNNHSSRISTYDSNRLSTYGSNRLSTYSINQSGGNYWFNKACIHILNQIIHFFFISLYIEIVGEPGTLTITVVGAKNLIAASDGGKTSNSYVKIKANGKKEVFKTSVIKKSTSPKWYVF